MKHLLPLLLLLWLPFAPALADEGMWLPGSLDKPTLRTMQELGFRMPYKQLYSPRHPSLKDAVVSFGGFCSGVVVSQQGLVFTNHHCGFSAVQQHSTPEHDYVTDGFYAEHLTDELPCPDLYVRFLIRTEDVTRRIRRALRNQSEDRRTAVIDSVSSLLIRQATRSDSTLTAMVDAYYGGNEYRLSVYRDYTDIRLVYAPPSSIGKFGRDKDNWMWPRHTGDFCIFRIYADSLNRPADYATENRPYLPAYVAPISTEGYQEGDFCMTLGYPGTTQRYLSSFGIQEQMNHTNQARIDVRSVKLAIWKQAMSANDTLRIKYASKYDESSNYWKNSIGTNRALRRLQVIEQKQQREQQLIDEYATDMSDEDLEDLPRPDVLLDSLKQAYHSRERAHHAQAYLIETFFNGAELLRLGLDMLNFDFGNEPKIVVQGLKDLQKRHADIDWHTDKEVFIALLQVYRNHVEKNRLLPLYQHIDTAYGGDCRAYADRLYKQSFIPTTEGLRRFVRQDSTLQVYNDPAISLNIDLLAELFGTSLASHRADEYIRRGERQLTALLKQAQSRQSAYPDANSTLRLSFGTVGGYRPADGIWYRHHTTGQGILEKAKAWQEQPEYSIQSQLSGLLRRKDFGQYADEKGEMHVCFLTNNDITGGNSGSAMFDGQGRLLGLAFDGNWEGISGDYRYEPQLQRCIGVDVRYILFLLEHYAHADRLMRELKPSLTSGQPKTN